jgi:hypothetical protein
MGHIKRRRCSDIEGGVYCRRVIDLVNELEDSVVGIKRSNQH